MKIALIGYGKMGRMIEEIILKENKHEVFARFNSANELTADKLNGADVAIEFTQPNLAVKNISICFDAGVPVVCGTTGWLAQIEEVKKLARHKNGSLIYASNFSVGVNLFFELNKQLAQLMNNHPQYKLRMEEIHHTEKKDAPSGTAISLANDIISITSKNNWVNNESGIDDEISIISHRLHNVTGTHIVQYKSDVDQIEIKHEAFNRSGFASGALLAAEIILKHKGVHTFSEILKLTNK